MNASMTRRSWLTSAAAAVVLGATALLTGCASSHAGHDHAMCCCTGGKMCKNDHACCKGGTCGVGDGCAKAGCCPTDKPGCCAPKK
jgi:hypothetical protein